MPQNTHDPAKPKHRTLRVYLKSVLARARKNSHQGDDRTHDLESELTRIKKRVSKTLDRINKEAEHDDSIDGSERATMKLDKTTKILTDEMMQLTALYHRQRDIAAIRRFLNQEHDIIRKSVTSKDDGKEKAQTLDSRIGEIHKLMHAERKRVAKATEKERIKFLLSITLAAASLAVSVYAILYH